MVRSLVFAPVLLLLSTSAHAQGVTTAGIVGIVSAAGAPAVEARIEVVHLTTGTSLEVRASRGRFLIQGLEPGGPYAVTARAVGFAPERRQNVFLALGELSRMDFALDALATTLDSVAIVARGDTPYLPAHADGGTGTTISAAMLEQLPTLNRDLYDFVRLVPQISTKIGLPNSGLSAGGVGFRFNNFLINGVSDRTLSGGVSNAFAGLKSIPLEAVREYQVLLAPYDVRYGDFAGALVNAVTRSGTNELHGSVFAYARNDELAHRRVRSHIRTYEKVQYGFSLGGPLVRDRLHFFIAPELQHFTYPAAGPYVGQPADAARAVPVTAADLDRFAAVMAAYGLTAGSARAVKNGNPLRNIFARVDLAPRGSNSRILGWHNYSGGDDDAFSRSARDTFSLSSYHVTRAARTRTSAVHVHTALPRGGGGHNELLVSYRDEALRPLAPVHQPIVRVSVPSASGGRVTLNSGSHESAHGVDFRSSALAVKENLTLPIGANHVLTLGAEVDRLRIRRAGVAGSYGTWTFASLDGLERGDATRYDVRVDFGGSGARLRGTHYAAFAGDQWRAHEHLSLTLGLRADLLALYGRAPYHPLVDSLFGRRTDQQPRRRVELSPRIGFVWDVSRAQQRHLRGGIGIFASRPPLAWHHATLSSYGVGGVLRCTSLGGSGLPPAFEPDPQEAPTACAGGATLTPQDPGDVNLLDPGLRMMRVLRGSIAHDWRLAPGLVLTNEAMLTRALSDFVLVNLNLPPPERTDPHGRTMYGTIGPHGIAVRNSRSPFTEVIDLRNTARNRSYTLSTRLAKTGSRGTTGLIAYAYGRARDVQTPVRVNTRGTVAWAAASAVSGRHEDLAAGISANDVPHRLVIAGTYATASTRARTELSFYYVGESGRPFTFLASGVLGRGDLNADGSSANDPVYVPASALDTLEFRFSGFSEAPGADNSTAAQAERELAQRTSFERFIDRTACLRRQRGGIMRRNSCREPWTNTMIGSVRQVIPVAAGALEAQLDVFNVLNLLNRSWGLRRDAVPALLEHVGQTSGPPETSRPVFRFSPEGHGWNVHPVESAFQLQLAVRYRF